MSQLIAVAGKGGTGKTTFCALTIRHLIKHGFTPVLAIDADANLNLNEVLGVEIKQTVGDVRDDLLKNMGLLPPGMDKNTWIELQLQDSLVETKYYDLVAMGKPEGTGCYCYVNSVLQRYMEILQNNYPFIVMDNEAGMEHISRGTTKNVDYLLIVSDASPRGVRTAARIRDLVVDLKLKVGDMALVLNRMGAKEVTAAALQEAQLRQLDIAGIIPADPVVQEFDLKDKSLLELPDNSVAVKSVGQIVKRITSKMALKAG